jgi:hypothetical protein
MKLRIVIAGMILMGFVLDGYGQRYYEKELLSTRLERKEMRQKASVADGGYVLFQGGLRKHENSGSNDVFTGGYGEYNGVVGVNYGYRLNNASLETGLGFIWQYHSETYFLEAAGENFRTFGNYNSIFLPFVLKYDVPTGTSKKFRFGAMGSINFLLHQTRNRNQQGRGTYYFDYFDDKERYVQYKYFWDSPRISGFFKVGLYSEFQVFKSSFLNLQFSRAISAGPLRTVTYEWEYQGQKGSFTDDLKIEGYMVEIAYKLPLNLFSATR